MPKSIYEDRKDAPPALVDVCLRMMDKRPDARFQSAGEVSQMLARWLEARGRDGGGSSPGMVKRTIGPPPRRSPSRSGSMPTFPPYRSDKTGDPDDTVSNLNRETFKGTPPNKPSSSTPGQSNLKFGGSNILGHPDPSNAGRSGSATSRGPSPPSHGGSSILGGSVLGHSGVGRGPGASGTGIGKSSKLPIAKSLDVPKAPPTPRDDTLGELIDQAVTEVKAASHQPPSHHAPSNASQAVPQYYSREPSTPMWIWFLLGAGLLFVVILIITVIIMAH